MKKYIKFIPVLASIFLIQLAGCVQAERNNPNDPGSKNYIGDNNNIIPQLNTVCNFFVSIGRGDDSNDGSWNLPFKTIAKAVEKSGDGDKIAVAAGNYETAAGLLIDKGLSLYGGYPDEEDFSWDDEERDSVNNLTSINDSRTSGGEALNPNAAVTITGSASSLTRIEGFRITGGDGSYSCVMLIDADAVDGFDLEIVDNLILGGEADLNLYGIFFRNYESSSSEFNIDIIRNTVSAGSLMSATNGPEVYGINMYSVAGDTVNANIWNCVIDAGYNEASAGTTAGSFGIRTRYVSPGICNNTIMGGDNTGTPGSINARGISIGEYSNPVIFNNIIFTGGSNGSKYGIFEEVDGPNCQHNGLRNNNVFNCATALYRSMNGGTYNLTEVTIEGNFRLLTEEELAPAGYDNISVDPAFKSANDWGLSSSTPESVYAGGYVVEDFVSISESIEFDRSGRERTAPWSIGAYEYEGGK